MATFVSGFVVGFTAVWQLALVTLAVVPLIAVIGGVHTVTLAKLSGKSQESLSEAGNIAEQVTADFLTADSFLIFVTGKISKLSETQIADNTPNSDSLCLRW